MSEAPPDANELALSRLRYELSHAPFHAPFHALLALEAMSVDVEAGEFIVAIGRGTFSTLSRA
ncbi:MAG: hypothetical protein H7238_16635 [Polaromonas sp.]|nr:hypothetical protein [Polaromonas sp.]